MNNGDINTFIENQYNNLIETDIKKEYLGYLDFYRNVENENLKHLFSYFQSNLNGLFNFMNQKKKSNGHYNADVSRELIDIIDYVSKLTKIVKSYKIDDEYLKIIEACKKFLVSSGGSPIPSDFEEIEILDYKAIFDSTTTIQTNDQNKSYTLKSIGSGSYAEVFKYKDENYNKYFALKKAKKNLVEKELVRFRLEFDSMKKLNSPYILEVYTFDENKNEYIMEYADETLYDYISKNNAKLSISERRNLIKQIFKAFEYINMVVGLHRDISPTNILLKHYDNAVVVKVADFGLVKIEDSNLTDKNTEFKGSLNDPKLDVIGEFKDYSTEHETYALTRLVYFVVTGRKVINKNVNTDFDNFIKKGISDSISERFGTVAEMRKTFDLISFI